MEEEEHFNMSIYVKSFQTVLEEFKNNKSIETFRNKNANYDIMLQQTELLHEAISMEKLHNQVREIIYSPIGTETSRTQVLKDFFSQNVSHIKYEDIKGNRAKYFYLHTYYLTSSYSNNETSNEEKYSEQITILEMMKKLIFENLQTFKKQDAFVMVSNLAGIYIKIKEKEKFYTCIKDIEDIVSISKEPHTTQMLYWKYIRLCEFYIEIPTEQMPQNIVEEIQNYLKTVTVQETKTSIIDKLATYFFIKQQYEQSKQLLDDFFLMKTIKMSDYHFLSLRLLYIILYYKTKEYHLAQRELLSLSRKMKREENRVLIIEKIFYLLKNIIQLSVKEENCQDSFKELLKIFGKNQDKKFTLEKLFIVSIWAKTKV